MATLVLNQGLQRIAINASAVGTAPGSSLSTSRWFQTMSIDDSAVALVITDTAANTGGAVANSYDAPLDATPTRAGQATSHVMTVPTGSGNFTTRRVILHDDTATNVTTSSTTPGMGVDGQAFTKTSSMTMTPTLVCTYT